MPEFCFSAFLFEAEAGQARPRELTFRYVVRRNDATAALSYRDEHSLRVRRTARVRRDMDAALLEAEPRRGARLEYERGYRGGELAYAYERREQSEAGRAALATDPLPAAAADRLSALFAEDAALHRAATARLGEMLRDGD